MRRRRLQMSQPSGAVTALDSPTAAAQAAAKSVNADSGAGGGGRSLTASASKPKLETLLSISRDRHKFGRPSTIAPHPLYLKSGGASGQTDAGSSGGDGDGDGDGDGSDDGHDVIGAGSEDGSAVNSNR